MCGDMGGGSCTWQGVISIGRLYFFLYGADYICLNLTIYPPVLYNIDQVVFVKYFLGNDGEGQFEVFKVA